MKRNPFVNPSLSILSRRARRCALSARVPPALLLALAIAWLAGPAFAEGARTVLIQVSGYELLTEPPPLQTPPAQQQQPPQQPALQRPEQSKTPGQVVNPMTPALQTFIDDIRFQGNRRYPNDTLKARLFSKKGDAFDPSSLQRDFMNLWNTGYFDDMRLEDEITAKGHLLTFVVHEKPRISTITYGKGMKSVSESDVLDRYKEKKLGLTVDSPYDPTKVRRAEVILQEFLGEKGHQFAKVEAKATRVPPNSIKLLFDVDEGPVVKVGQIAFEGNNVLDDRTLTEAMKYTKPIGIPKSIYLENLFARSYDQSKMEYDLELVRTRYQEHGYFKALILDPKLVLYDTEGRALWQKLLIAPVQLATWGRYPGPPKPGKRVDITVPVQEGELYYMGKASFTGVKFFRKPEMVFGPRLQMGEGDVFNISKVRKAIEQIKNIYGEFGFINEVTEPQQDFDEANHKINMIFAIDEDRQFFVHRIEFSGNTTTRDKVIRREILLNEGDMFNHRLWEISVLRLNQLGFFDPIKKEQEDDGVKPNNRDGTVDILLKVKEKGKNTIGLTGGVSGIAGSFIGLNYRTNNFLGLGETLTFDVQLGTIERNVLFGFTEPHFLDKRYAVGFTIYDRRYSFNQARQASILSGQNLIGYYDSLGQQNLLNYVQNSRGVTVFTTYPVGRGFSRVGITYGFDKSHITTFSDAAAQYFEYLNYNSVNGPNSLAGITTSKITPSYSYNTVNSPLNPTTGKSVFLGAEMAGIGGTVRLVRPTASFTYYHPMNHRRNTFAMRVMGSYLTGYGGRVAPPFERFFIGGENDIRGFYIRSISPLGYIPSSVSINVLDSDGSPRSTTVIVNGVAQSVPQTMNIPINQLTYPGGDTMGVGNFEYRIPIVGPVTLAPFFDTGMDMVLRKSELQINPDHLAQLDQSFPNLNLGGRVQLVPGTNNQMHTSTGLELQVVLPVVQAPFRLYYAFNIQRVNIVLNPPIIVDKTQFPNNATYQQALQYSQYTAYDEPNHMLMFTVSRTF